MAYQYQYGGGLLEGSPKPSGYQYQAGSNSLIQPSNKYQDLDADTIWDRVRKDNTGTVSIAQYHDKKNNKAVANYLLPKESLKEVATALGNQKLSAYYADRELKDYEKTLSDLKWDTSTDSGGSEITSANWTSESVEAYNKLIGSGINTNSKLVKSSPIYIPNTRLKGSYIVPQIDLNRFNAYKKEQAFNTLYNSGLPTELDDADSFDAWDSKARILKYNKDFIAKHGKIPDKNWYKGYNDVTSAISSANSFAKAASDLYNKQSRAIKEVGVGNLYIPYSVSEIRGLMMTSFKKAAKDFKGGVYTEVTKENKKRQALINKARKALESL